MRLRGFLFTHTPTSQELLDRPLLFCRLDLRFNGRVFFLTPSLINKPVNRLSKALYLMPEFVGRWSHSDLHFSNVLIDLKNDTFRCIDPRGYNYCDPYYDFGKLWHSVNGKYEMVANDMWTIEENCYKLTENYYFNFLENLKVDIKERIFNVLPVPT